MKGYIFFSSASTLLKAKHGASKDKNMATTGKGSFFKCKAEKQKKKSGSQKNEHGESGLRRDKKLFYFFKKGVDKQGALCYNTQALGEPHSKSLEFI